MYISLMQVKYDDKKKCDQSKWFSNDNEIPDNAWASARWLTDPSSSSLLEEHAVWRCLYVFLLKAQCHINIIQIYSNNIGNNRQQQQQQQQIIRTCRRKVFCLTIYNPTQEYIRIQTAVGYFVYNMRLLCRKFFELLARVHAFGYLNGCCCCCCSWCGRYVWWIDFN